MIASDNGCGNDKNDQVWTPLPGGKYQQKRLKNNHNSLKSSRQSKSDVTNSADIVGRWKVTKILLVDGKLRCHKNYN